MKAILKKSFFLLTAVFIAVGCTATDPNIETAKLSFKSGDYDKALESINTAITNNPSNADAYNFKGNVLAEQAQKKANPADRLPLYTDMRIAYKTAISIYDTTNKKPQSQLIDINVTRYWASEHNSGIRLVAIDGTPEPAAIKKAEAHFTNAIAIEPDSITSYEILAEVYLMDNNYDKAIEYMSLGMSKQEKPDMSRYLRLAAFYEMNKNDDAVLNTLREAESNYPDSIGVVQSLANAYLRINDTDNALATVKKLIDSEPENAQYRLVYGTQLYTTTETLATELESNYELLSVLKKDVKATKDKKTQARLTKEIDSLKTADKSLKIKIDDLTEKALVQLRKVIELQPEDGPSNFTIGAIIQNKAASIFKDRDMTDDNKEASKLDKLAKSTLNEALPYYEKAVEISPNEKDYWMTLFRVYTTLGMTDKAQVAMEKAGL